MTWGSHDLGAEGELHQLAPLAPGEGRGRDLPEGSPPHASLLSPNQAQGHSRPVPESKAASGYTWIPSPADSELWLGLSHARGSIPESREPGGYTLGSLCPG